MASLIEVANSLGKSFKEVEDYTDNTTAVTANDLGLDESRAKRITDLDDPPPRPAKPTVALDDHDVQVDWVAVTRGVAYRVHYQSIAPGVDTQWVSGLTYTVTDLGIGAWMFKVQAKNSQGVWSEWSPPSDQVFINE